MRGEERALAAHAADASVQMISDHLRRFLPSLYFCHRRKRFPLRILLPGIIIPPQHRSPLLPSPGVSVSTIVFHPLWIREAVAA